MYSFSYFTQQSKRNDYVDLIYMLPEVRQTCGFTGSMADN